MSSIETDPTAETFTSVGTTTDRISVKIGHRIIQLFSEGLYSSSNKAVEELVSNAYDAGAKNVHIILSPDLRDRDATIVVIDDGEGMNPKQLKQHWIIGESTRRGPVGSLRRKPIGKFGIGKLSTYVLGSKLTHISKSGDEFFAATMNYSDVTRDQGTAGGVFSEQIVDMPLRTLTRDEAKDVLRPWLRGKKPGHKALDLFGPKEPTSWTVAIISDLKKMGKEIKLGRLLWVLKTAMPQSSDFRLFVDGERVTQPRLSSPLKRWVIGKDVVQLNKPAPEGFVARQDPEEPENVNSSVWRLSRRIRSYYRIHRSIRESA